MKYFLPLLILSVCFALSGCRTGTGANPDAAEGTAAAAEAVFGGKQPGKEEIIPMEEPLEIIYVHGWLQNYHQPEIMAIIEGIFPGSTARQYLWTSIRAWPQAVENADAASLELAAEIAALPKERRERTILMGHSLGGRMVVRVLARLSERGLRVRQAVLLGSAIPDNDPDIEKAFHGTLSPILNLCNPEDVTLKYCYGAFGEQMCPPLGANGWLRRHPMCFDIVVSNDITGEVALSENFDILNHDLIKRVANHHVRFYLGFLQDQVENDFVVSPPILVPQDKVNLELPVTDKRVFWVEEDEFGSWSLQRHILTGHYRILDADKHRRAWGAKSRMIESFEKVKQQLRETE